MQDNQLPERDYLEKHVMSALLAALEQTAVEKPTDPLTFIG